MRYVDIDLLDLPLNWQARANKALNDLRSEIIQAEVDATNAGLNPSDIAAARKKAVRDGLDIPARKKIWQDLSKPLKDLSKDKCWYSESKNPTADKDVDHFRPKNRVEGDPDHEGYWWLAFDWRNYRCSSQWCNQRRNDKVNATVGGKWDAFPLRIGSFRARQETDDWTQEEVELLDPTDPSDWKLLTFRVDGQPIPTKPAGTPEHNRAIISIDVYHLHCKELVDDRRPLAGKIQRLVQEMELHHPLITDIRERTLYKERQKEIIRAIHRDTPYSAAALAYARAEIYTMRYGHQVKRPWLEDLLNSNP